MGKSRNIADLLSADGKVSADSLDIGAVGGRRNLIINGGFDVWQRSVGPVSGSGYQSADRWVTYSSVAQVTEKQADNEGNYVKLTINNVNYQFTQFIENINNWMYDKQYTVSFTVRSPTLTSAVVKSYNQGTGTTIEEHSYPITSTWTRVTRTFSASTAWQPGQHLRLYVVSSPNTTGVVELRDVQLELGTVATPFERRSYNEELLDCSRYYVKLEPPNTTAFGPSYSQTTDLNRTTIALPVPMRACPTVSKTANMYSVGIANTTGAISSIAINSVSGVGATGATHAYSNQVAINLHHSNGGGNQGTTYFYGGVVTFDAEIA